MASINKVYYNAITQRVNNEAGLNVFKLCTFSVWLTLFRSPVNLVWSTFGSNAIAVLA